MADIQEILGKRVGGQEEYVEYQTALEDLAGHMYDISDNPQGSDPAKYLSGEELAQLRWFMDMADELDWPQAEPLIEMQVPYIPGISPILPALGRLPMLGRLKEPLNAWESYFSAAKDPVSMRAFTRIAGPIRGIPCAWLNIPRGSQPVAIGEDHLLYSLRGRELPKSKALGWGSLPEPEYMLPAIKQPVKGPTKRLLAYRRWKDLPNALSLHIDTRKLTEEQRKKIAELTAAGANSKFGSQSGTHSQSG